VLFEEGLNDFHVHSVVHVGVELESRGEEVLVSEAAVVDELGVLLVVVCQAGDLAALPVEVAHVGGPVQGNEEEEAVHKDRPLAHVLELNGIACLHHFDNGAF
jgi:hypothetical protein